MAKESVSAQSFRARIWRSRIAACEASGKTIAQWCRDEGVAAHQYHWWKRRLAQGCCPDSPTPVFVEVAAGAACSLAASPIEVALAGSRVVRVHPGFDALTLQAVVSALEGLPACAAPMSGRVV